MRAQQRIALDLLDNLRALLDTGDPDRSPRSVLGDLVPAGVNLYASYATATGRWYYYLIMPPGWTPPEMGNRWIHNPAGYYWDTGSEATEREALIRGLQRLTGVLV